MQYSYEIIYDIDTDIDNWYGALNDRFEGFNFDWIDNIDNDDDRKIARSIVGVSRAEAEKILKPYLLTQFRNPRSRLNKFIKIINKDFSKKYVAACRAIEDITQRPLMSNKFTFCVTTFPRSQYFYADHVITMYDSTEDFWGMPIDGFLHEVLHFQFIYYWSNDKNSPVSRLSEEDFDYLKEALTVVIDDSLKPLVTLPDGGHGSQAEIRKLLHKHWREYHDFNKLVEYGIKKLPEYTSKA